MKKPSTWLTALVIAACLTLLAYQFTYCDFGRLFEDGMKGTRDYRFEPEISKEEAINHFSDYGKMVRTWQVKEEGKDLFDEEKIVTWIVFENGDETLELKFVNDKLCGFKYVDWGIE